MQLPFLLLIGAIVLGVLSGLLPGLHPNSIGAVIIQIFGQNVEIAYALIIIAGVHCALAFLPSIFLGVPEGQTQIALLPGQRMFSLGRGEEAAVVVAVSVVVASILSILAIPFIIPILPSIFSVVEPYIGYILLIAAAALLAHEIGREKIFKAGVVFLLAAILGKMVLDMPMHEPLFALFVGFFTMPALLSGNLAKPKIIKNEKQDYSLSYMPYVFAGVLLGALADLIPGISTPAQIAVFTSMFFKMDSARNFLAHVAAIEASHTVFAIASAASIKIARVGTIAMAQGMADINVQSWPSFAGAFLFSAALGAFLLARLAGPMGRKIGQIDMDLIAKILGAYLIVMTFFSDGILGLVVLATAFAIGYLPLVWRVSRTHVMGSLIGPSILHAFGV
ncbi:MAG: tripartite tricarboxylate transporter permease [Candidatus Micrarchaeia archaeon]